MKINRCRTTRTFWTTNNENSVIMANIEDQIREWARLCKSEGGTQDPHLVCEMATVGWPIIDKVEYKLSIHGVNTRDRPIPHIHLDRADDPERKNFKFEISLVDLLETGEPVLVLQKDRARHINRTNKKECNWNGYKKLHDGVLAYLESDPEDDAPRGSRSNLESFIKFWNKESGTDPNCLAEYIKEHGVTVLEKYRIYFPQLYSTQHKKKPDTRNAYGKK